MTTAATPRVPKWYWIVAGLTTVWMLIGLASFVMDVAMHESLTAGMSEAQLEVLARRPGWIVVLYGIATVTGVAGAVGLLLRRRWCVPLFALSFVAALVQFAYTLVGPMQGIALLGAAVALPLPLAVLVWGAAAWWLGTHATQRAWLH
jgi:hypothetical protein